MDYHCIPLWRQLNFAQVAGPRAKKGRLTAVEGGFWQSDMTFYARDISRTA